MPHGKRTASGVLGGLLGLVGLSAVAGLLVTATVTPAIAVSGYAASSAITLFDKLPGYLEVDQPMLPTTIYATNPDNGEPWELASFYDQNRTPVTWDQVPQIMYDAIISSEDPRYYEHGGVDLIGTTRAVLNNASGGDTQGGSSISQQYVKNVLIQQCEQSSDGDTVEERDAAREQCYLKAVQSDGGEGIQRKLQEMRYAIAIEKEYSKDDILLGYLNIANFGGITYGIEAAARYYFSESAKDLTLVQAATLAGIVQNPNYYRIDMPDGTRELADGTMANTAENGYEQTKQRRNYVLGRMFEDGKISEAEYNEAKEAPVEPKINPRRQGCITAGGSAYFCEYVKNVILNDPAFGDTPEKRRELLRRGGLKVYTTIDLKLQMTAEQAMKNNAPAYIDGMNFGAAGVSVEANTGRILQMVQNTNFSEDPNVVNSEPGYSAQVWAADSAHGTSRGFAVGSTFKVFTLLDWLEQGHSINQRLNGIDRIFGNFSCDGNPVPFGSTRLIGNFARDPGWYGSVRQFTEQSLNSGYFAMAEQLNLCDIMRVADRLNVKTGDGVRLMEVDDNGDGTPDHPVPYDILGSFNIAPLTMASVYATIANNGVQCTPKAIDRVLDAEGNELKVPEGACEQKLQPEIAATAAHVLASVMNNGTGRPANSPDAVPVLGKTGTHQQWQTSMIQSSTKVATAVWVGNFLGDTDLFRTYTSAGVASNLRYAISREIQGAANLAYGGDAFPPPDRNLIRIEMRDLPSVIGKSVEEAQRILWNAGFQPAVGDPVPGQQPEGMIESQTPGAGRVAGGTTVTINPSNGNGGTVPDVRGQSMESAFRAIADAGFTPQMGDCEETKNGGAGRVTGTSPGGGEVVPRGTSVSVDFEARKCGGDR